MKNKNSNINEEIIDWIKEKLQKENKKLVKKLETIYKSEDLKKDLCTGIKKLLGNNIKENVVKDCVFIGHGGIGDFKTAKYFIPGTFPGTATLMTSTKDLIVYYMGSTNRFWKTIFKNLLPIFNISEKKREYLKKTLNEILTGMSDVRKEFNKYNKRIKNIVGNKDIKINNKKLTLKWENYYLIRNWLEKNDKNKIKELEKVFVEIKRNIDIQGMLKKLNENENNFCKTLGIYLGDRSLVAFCPASSLDKDRYPILLNDFFGFINKGKPKNKKILLNGPIDKKVKMTWLSYKEDMPKGLTVYQLSSSSRSRIKDSTVVKQRGNALDCDNNDVKKIYNRLKRKESKKEKNKEDRA